MTKWVYAFGGGSAEGRSEMKNLLGGKGANLAEMANLGLPVPPGFSITTEVCTYYYANGQRYPEDLKPQVEAALSRVEGIIGASSASIDNPLLVSVRSGARASMPGMMDTVLNLGLNDQTVEGLAVRAKDRRFAYDSYRRFIQMYSDVVLGVDTITSRTSSKARKRTASFRLDTELSAEDWVAVVAAFKDKVEEELAGHSRISVEDQLWGAIGAVFGSWMNQRAIAYRRLHDIPADWGTAVSVQAMVFGNMGDDCATGVAFTRNPSTGDNEFYGEYLVNAQGEDVVAGIRTPQYLTTAARWWQAPPCRQWKRSCRRCLAISKRFATRWKTISPTCRTRIHRTAGQAVDAADPDRQAHRGGGPEDRRRSRQGRVDFDRDGGPAHRAWRPRSVVPSDPRSHGGAEGPGARPAGVAGRGIGPGGVFRR